MKNLLKKISLVICACLPTILIGYVTSQSNIAPDYETDFINYFKKDNSVATIPGVSHKNKIEHNLQCIFYPNNAPVNCGENGDNGYGGYIWKIMKYIGYALLVIFIVIAGIQLLLNGSNAEKVKPALSSLLYMILGSLLFFGSVRILGSKLRIGTTFGGVSGLSKNIYGDKTSLLFFVLSFAKAMAFIAAIVMMVVHGFKMMSAADKSDKVKAGLKGLLNVIIALVIIKMIDYIYYIAQVSNIVSKTTDLIIEIAKVMGFIIGALMVIMLFYAGILYITDQGNGEKMKKATNIIIGILVAALVIFSLLLIIYEIFNEFVE